MTTINNANNTINFTQFTSNVKQAQLNALLEIVGDEKFIPDDLLADVRYEQLRNSRMVECQRLLEQYIIPAFENAGIDIRTLDDVSEYSTPYRVLDVGHSIKITLDYQGDNPDGQALSVSLVMTTEKGGKGILHLFSVRLGDGNVTVDPRAMDMARDVFKDIARWSVATRAIVMKITTSVVDYFNK